MIEKNIQRARQLLQESDAIFITAGTGMGVNYVLPDKTTKGQTHVSALWLFTFLHYNSSKGF